MATNLLNRAQVTYDGAVAAVLSNQVTTQLVDANTIELTKTAVVDEVAEGSDAIYVVRLENTGSGNLEDIKIKDNLGGHPNRLEYVDGSALFFVNGNPVSGTATVEDEYVKFDVDTVLEPGDSLIIIYASTVLEGDYDEITNKVKAKARVCCCHHKGKSVKAEAEETITVTENGNSPIVSIFKSASQETVVSGDTLTYSFTLMNTGDEPAENVKFEDEFPEQFEVESVSITENGTTTVLDPSDYTVEDQTLTIPAESSSLEITVPAATDEGPGIVEIEVTGTIE